MFLNEVLKIMEFLWLRGKEYSLETQQQQQQQQKEKLNSAQTVLASGFIETEPKIGTFCS